MQKIQNVQIKKGNNKINLFGQTCRFGLIKKNMRNILVIDTNNDYRKHAIYLLALEKSRSLCGA